MQSRKQSLLDEINKLADELDNQRVEGSPTPEAIRFIVNGVPAVESFDSANFKEYLRRLLRYRTDPSDALEQSPAFKQMVRAGIEYVAIAKNETEIDPITHDEIINVPREDLYIRSDGKAYDIKALAQWVKTKQSINDPLTGIAFPDEDQVRFVKFIRDHENVEVQSCLNARKEGEGIEGVVREEHIREEINGREEKEEWQEEEEYLLAREAMIKSQLENPQKNPRKQEVFVHDELRDKLHAFLDQLEQLKRDLHGLIYAPKKEPYTYRIISSINDAIRDVHSNIIDAQTRQNADSIPWIQKDITDIKEEIDNLRMPLTAAQQDFTTSRAKSKITEVKEQGPDKRYVTTEEKDKKGEKPANGVPLRRR